MQDGCVFLWADVIVKPWLYSSVTVLKTPTQGTSEHFNLFLCSETIVTALNSADASYFTWYFSMHSRVFRLSGYHCHSTVCKVKQKTQTQLASSKNRFPVQKTSSKLSCRCAEVHWRNRSQVWFWGFLRRTGWGGSELAALSKVLRCVSDSSVKLELSAVGWE